MADKTRVYIDACPLIDLVKFKVGMELADSVRKDVWYAQKMVEAAMAGDIELLTSTLTIAECTHVKDKAKFEAAKPFFMGLLSSGKAGVLLIQATQGIAERARDLRWLDSVNLKGADAIHVASAIHLKCDELLTGDTRILRSASVLAEVRIRVCKPADTQKLPGKYFQESFDLPAPPSDAIN